jgi:hypothetical protein
LSDFPFEAPVTTENLLDAVVYGAAGPGLTALLLPGQAPLDEDARGAAGSDSNQRCPDGGLPRTTNTFIQKPPTPDGPNDCAVDLPPAVAEVFPTPSAIDVPFDVVVEINYSEPVILQDGAVEIGCSASGILDYTIAGSGSAYTFTPESPLLPGELCTTKTRQISWAKWQRGTSRFSSPSPKAC